MPKFNSNLIPLPVQVYFEDMYDELGDEGLDELERRSYLLREQFQKVLEFMQNIQGERRMERLDLGTKGVIIE